MMDGKVREFFFDLVPYFGFLFFFFTSTGAMDAQDKGSKHQLANKRPLIQSASLLQPIADWTHRR